MKPVVVSRPEVESQGEFISQEFSNRYVGQGHHVVLQADVLDVVRSVGITRGPDHAVVVVEGEFILQAVPERALIERHVALEQIEIQWDVESIAISIGNGLVCCNRCILISSTYSDY